MLNDLKNENDIKHLVDTFYAKVNNDPLLSPVFNEIAKIDWEHHLPKMYNFWNTLLFYKGTYSGNAYAVHEPLPLTAEHFAHWLGLFEETLKENFEGENATIALNKAKLIGATFMAKKQLL